MPFGQIDVLLLILPFSTLLKSVTNTKILIKKTFSIFKILSYTLILIYVLVLYTAIFKTNNLNILKYIHVIISLNNCQKFIKVIFKINKNKIKNELQNML
jgi:hypothetical protein